LHDGLVGSIEARFVADDVSARIRQIPLCRRQQAPDLRPSARAA